MQQTNQFDSPPLNDRITSESSSTLAPISGVINPVTIEQRGYTSTDNMTARTDTLVNTQQNIEIDTSHDWVASNAEVQVWDLERLYVINGTFDEGYEGYTIYPNGSLTNYPFGWDAISNNTDPDQVQQVSYEKSSERYITVQNRAEITKPVQREYTHYAGTYVLWNQTFHNTPYTDQFLLSFDYLLLQGPLSSSFTGNYSLKVFINDTAVHSIDLPTLGQRGTWFAVNEIPVSIAMPTEAISFRIGLYIDSTFMADADLDYDGDGYPDGTINTQYITVCIDDVSLTGATLPSCNEVDLHLMINGAPTPIIGDSGLGSGYMTNDSFWTASPLNIEIASNESVSLQYRVQLLNHRFLNSSSTTSTFQMGVSYIINANQSASLEMFTYLGFLGLYDDLIIRIYHPSDWQNFTILDPFLTDVTLECTFDSNFLDIPTILLDRLGWWKILCESPNYASIAITERYEIGTMSWNSETIFHSNDIARVSISFNSNGEIPFLSDPVNFTWKLPNSSLWYESSTISDASGSAESTPITFGPANTTAGTWSVVYHWTNGSEIAYDYVNLTLYHQAALQVVFSEKLETVVSQPVTVIIRFFDLENGLFLLNDGAEVIGTWAAGVVDFVPNVVQNWWQADFDTSLVGAGNFDVIISSAAPYFETTPLIITIKSQFLSSIDPPNGPLEPLIYGHQYSYDYFYSIDYNGSGVADALVEISGEGSEWASITDEGNGHYNLTVVPWGLRDYSLYISFSKVGHQNQTHVLSFLVNKVPMRVNMLTNLRAPEYQQLTIEVEVVESDTEYPVSGANVSLNLKIQGVSHEIKIMNETTEYSGIYSAKIVMPEASEYTYDIIISVEKENYELTQEFSYPLIPTFDATAKFLQTIIFYSPQILVFVGAFAMIVAGQKYYSRKRRQTHALAKNVKARFNDANNLLGIVVLHKLSGVPIYSKILKGGFEEGMLSAFITAIMHFRTEFDKQREHDDYIIIPISDIVRSVPTQNLICAFITITSASKAQEEKMINYARAIGMMFDESLAERPTQVVDAKMIKTFEWMFDDFVDGVLVRLHRIGEKRLPKKLRCVEDVVNTEDGIDSFMLVNLMQLLESCGIDEDDAYLLVMDAIEQEYFVPVYSNNNNSGTDLSVR